MIMTYHKHCGYILGPTHVRSLPISSLTLSSMPIVAALALAERGTICESSGKRALPLMRGRLPTPMGNSTWMRDNGG